MQLRLKPKAIDLTPPAALLPGFSSPLWACVPVGPMTPGKREVSHGEGPSGASREGGGPGGQSTEARRRAVRARAQQGSGSPHSAAGRDAGPREGLSTPLCPQSSPRRPHLKAQLSPPSDSGFGCPPAHTQGWVRGPITGRAVARVPGWGAAPAGPRSRALVCKERPRWRMPLHLLGRLTPGPPQECEFELWWVSVLLALR